MTSLYQAKRCLAETEAGTFEASRTLCGHIDFIGPFRGTYSLSPDEALALVIMLQKARSDVLENSDPRGDPRLVDRSPTAPLKLSGVTEGLRTSGAALGDESAQDMPAETSASPADAEVFAGLGAERTAAIHAAVRAPKQAPEWVKPPFNGAFYAEMYKRHALEECDTVDRVYDGDWGRRIFVWLATGADMNGPPQGSYHHVCHALARAALALSGAWPLPEAPK